MQNTLISSNDLVKSMNNTKSTNKSLFFYHSTNTACYKYNPDKKEVIYIDISRNSWLLWISRVFHEIVV